MVAPLEDYVLDDRFLASLSFCLSMDCDLALVLLVLSLAVDVPRAMEAVDADHPHGTTGYNNNGYTVLQQHIAFFDRNHDGVIYPWETFQGTISISGLSVVISLKFCCV